MQASKGIVPSESEKQQFLKQDIETSISEASALSVTPSYEGRAQVISEAAPGLSVAGGELSGDPDEPVSLAQAVGGQMGFDTAKGLATGSIIPGTQGAVSASQFGKSPITGYLSGTTASIMNPISAVMLANNLGSQISAGIIGNNISEMYGHEIAQQVADVVAGKSDPQSLQGSAMEAYINSLIAMENAPKTITSLIAGKIKGKKAFDITSAPSGLNPGGGYVSGLDDFSDPLGLVGSGVLSAPNDIGDINNATPIGPGELGDIGPAPSGTTGGIGAPDLSIDPNDI